MTTPAESHPISMSQESEYWFPYHYVGRMPDFGFAQHFVDSWAINYISTIEFVLKMVAQDAPHSLVDIGCGDGRLTREIHNRFPNIKISGIDISSRAITLAKAMNQDAPGVSFAQSDITKAPPSEPYDSAVLMEVLEHVPPTEVSDFLAGVRQALKKEGILYLTVPHTNKAVEYKHFQHFTTESITHYLNQSFDIMDVVPFEKKCLARRLIGILLCNELFVLSNRKILQEIYKFHSRFLFHCASEQQCQRLFVRARAK